MALGMGETWQLTGALNVLSALLESLDGAVHAAGFSDRHTEVDVTWTDQRSERYESLDALRAGLREHGVPDHASAYISSTEHAAALFRLSVSADRADLWAHGFRVSGIEAATKRFDETINERISLQRGGSPDVDQCELAEPDAIRSWTPSTTIEFWFGSPDDFVALCDAATAEVKRHAVGRGVLRCSLTYATKDGRVSIETLSGMRRAFDEEGDLAQVTTAAALIWTDDHQITVRASSNLGIVLSAESSDKAWAYGVVAVLGEEAVKNQRQESSSKLAPLDRWSLWAAVWPVIAGTIFIYLLVSGQQPAWTTAMWGASFGLGAGLYPLSRRARRIRNPLLAWKEAGSAVEEDRDEPTWSASAAALANRHQGPIALLAILVSIGLALL